MSQLPPLITDLALMLIVAGVVTIVFKRLKQPLVLGYIVAGFLVSPHMPYTPSVVETTNIHVWADIGVMFLLFSLGLDFSFKKIMKMGAAPIIAVSSIIFSMIFLGILAGKLFGWGRMDCIFLGGMLAMSSTTIIYKAFDDMGLRQQQFAGLVMSVLILEDILAIVMMVMLSAIASDSGADGGAMLSSILKIGFFLVLWFIVGIFAIPGILRRNRKIINSEVLLIVSLGLCCAMAVFSSKVGFSSAFGAFVMGSILAETIESKTIIRVVEPVKNLFGAVFFVSVGMLVDPQILIDYALPIFVLVLTILLGQSIFGTFSFLLSGQSLKSAMKCGFSMAQIGEFSFIIASLGLSLGVIGNFLYPVVVAVSVITTFLTPYMIRFATPCHSYLEQRLPKIWIDRLNKISVGHPSTKSHNSNWHTLLIQMLRNTLIYSILSSAVIALMFTFFEPFIIKLFGKNFIMWSRIICGVTTFVLIAPFLRAMVMKKNRSEEWKALWAESWYNRVPLLFTVIVRLVIALSFVFTILNHYFHFSHSLLTIIGLTLIIGIIMSRRTKNRSIRLERMFIQNLRSRDIEAQVLGKKRPLYEGKLLDRDVHIAEVIVPEGSIWAGKSLKDLQIGRRFGVHVSSILRAGRRYNIPGGSDVIFPNDRIQVIGSDDQLKTFNDTIEREIYDNDPDIEKREMLLRQLVIGKASDFNGKTLSESGIRKEYNCMVVGIEEGKENLSSIDNDYRFREGDIIWVVGEIDDINRLLG